MKHSAKPLTDPPTKKGGQAFLRGLIGHIESPAVTIHRATVDYDVANS